MTKPNYITLAVAALALSTGIGADAYEGEKQDVVIERVLDGDTVAIQGWRQHARLANIDAPELSHGYSRPGQPFSIVASKGLGDLLAKGAAVSVQCPDVDRYQRPVCTLYKGDVNVNRQMVVQGLAWANTSNLRYLRDKSLVVDQEQAKQARRGLWADANPVQPWAWRSDCWIKKICPSQP